MNNPFESNPYEAPSSATAGPSPFAGKQYGGIRRLAYFGYSFLAAIVYQVVILGSTAALGGAGGGDQVGIILMVIVIISLLLYLAALFYIASQRLINIGSSPWWCLGLIVPLLNIFVGIRCLICPEGYDDHKTLDGPAKVVLGLSIGLIVLSVALLFLGIASA